MSQDPPKRQPRVGGVRIPSKAPPADAPPSEKSFYLLKEIKDQLDVEQARNRHIFRDYEERLTAHDVRLDEQESRMLAIQRGMIDADERASRIDDTTRKTLAAIVDMRGTDLDLERRVQGVESRLAARAEVAGAEAGELAGTKAGRKISIPALLMAVASLLGWLVDWLRQRP